MTEKGDPYENAIAERVNGILKTEFGLDRKFDNFQQAWAAVVYAIHTYNSIRPHASINYMTPDQAQFEQGTLQSRWTSKRQIIKQLDEQGI